MIIADGTTKIDVVVVTKNELPSWWIKKNLSRVPTNNLIIERSKPLAMARMRAIQKVTTEWFVFIDDDVLLGKNWWSMIKQHIADDVGAISGRDYFVNYKPCLNAEINKQKKLRGNYELGLGDRGPTICTLMRTEVVKDWKPIRTDLNAFEDYLLTQHVLKKSYRWLNVDSDALHLSWTLAHIPKQVHWNTIGLYKLKLPPYKRMFNCIYESVFSFSAALLRIKKGKHSLRYSMWKCYYNFWKIAFLLYEGFKQPFLREKTISNHII